MPGRRTPRQTAGQAKAQHADRAFSGGLDGASLLPAPVEDEETESLKRKPSQLFFHQDEFILYGGVQQVALTYLPETNSEHVYLCPGGASTGTYQPEKTTWERSAGTKALQVLSGMNTRSGDVLVVEYAYYEAVTSTEPTWDGVYYGPWLDGPITSGQLMQPKVHNGYSGSVNGVPTPAYLVLGDGTTYNYSHSSNTAFVETESNAAAGNPDLQYAQCLTMYIWPGYYSFSGHQWQSASCVHYPVWDGIAQFEPSSQMFAVPRAVGWDYGPVQYFDAGRCSTTTVLQTMYNKWRLATNGYNAYRIYRETTPVGPIISGGYMEVWYRKAFFDTDRPPDGYPTPYRHTVLVGTAGGYVIKPATYKPTVFKDRIFTTSGLTPISPSVQVTPVGTPFATNPFNGEKFTVSLLPEPRYFPNWGWIRAPAYRHVEAPGTIFPNYYEPYSGLLGNGFNVEACLDFKCYGAAQNPKYRLIYAKV